MLVQSQFISQIWDNSIKKLNYWEKLSELRAFSQERRQERYQICFLWKLSQGLISGYSITWQFHERRGRLAVPNSIPKSAATKVKKARERTLGVHGARLFKAALKTLETKIRGTFLSSRIIWTFFLQPFLTKQTPQDWLGLQSQTVCVTRSPFVIHRAFLFKSNTVDLTLVS